VSPSLAVSDVTHGRQTGIELLGDFFVCVLARIKKSLDLPHLVVSELRSSALLSRVHASF
jgi:hypothetical protein